MNTRDPEYPQSHGIMLVRGALANCILRPPHPDPAHAHTQAHGHDQPRLRGTAERSCRLLIDAGVPVLCEAGRLAADGAIFAVDIADVSTSLLIDFGVPAQCPGIVRFDAGGVLRVMDALHRNGLIEGASNGSTSGSRNGPGDGAEGRVRFDSSSWSADERDVLLEWLSASIGELSDLEIGSLKRLDLFETEDGRYTRLEGIAQPRTVPDTLPRAELVLADGAGGGAGVGAGGNDGGGEGVSGLVLIRAKASLASTYKALGVLPLSELEMYRDHVFPRCALLL